MYRKVEMKFGEWLKLRRLAAEMTPLDLAHHLGVDIAVYKEIEADRQGITEPMMVKLSKIEKLRVTMRDLTSRTTAVGDTAFEQSNADAANRKPDPLTEGKSLKRESDAKRQARRREMASRMRPPLAIYLEQQMIRAGLTKFEAADQCGVLLEAFDDIEEGMETDPSTLKKIADGLGLPLDLLEFAEKSG